MNIVFLLMFQPCGGRAWSSMDMTLSDPSRLLNTLITSDDPGNAGLIMTRLIVGGCSSSTSLCAFRQLSAASGRNCQIAS